MAQLRLLIALLVVVGIVLVAGAFVQSALPGVSGPVGTTGAVLVSGSALPAEPVTVVHVFPVR